jgi:hypothetical protein
LVQKGIYISNMFLKGDSVILVIKRQEEDDAASIVMGPKGMSGLYNAKAEMDPLDERRVKTNMLCPDQRLLQDPGDGPKSVETAQDFVESIGYTPQTIKTGQWKMS